ncbi:unnamed protein product [Polarella glacialis]|uniref:Uncharacterized protein n=1 Tax=Polarella glacialis TaxID=89957 RepID=A0A813F9E4_POLGL|nr:unnamed protein product [Polarella glacialis]
MDSQDLVHAASAGLLEVLQLPGLAEVVLFCAAPSAARRAAAVSRHLHALLSPLLPEIERLVPRRICVVGGHGGRGMGPHEPLCTAQLFDTVGGCWESLPGPTSARYDCAMAASEGFLYVIGGRCVLDQAMSSVERLDLGSAKQKLWQPMPSLLVPRYQCAAAAVSGIVFVAGGFDGLEPLSTAECLIEGFHAGFRESDGSTDLRWRPLPDLDTARGRCAACSLGGWFYLLGGMDAGYRSLSAVDRLPGPKLLKQATEFIWTPLPQMLQARGGCAAVRVGDAILAIGGVADGWAALSDVERFDPMEGCWQHLQPMGRPRRECAAAVVAGVVYVMGGVSHAGRCTATAECWDTAAEAPCWHPSDAMSEARCSCNATTLWA